MALLKWIIIGVLGCATGCVDSDFEPRELRVDMGPSIITTCAEAAQFGVTCGAFLQPEVALLVERCQAFNDEPWTRCAITIGEADCAAVSQCAFPVDGGVGCMTHAECGANQSCVDDRCTGAVQ